MMPTEEKEFEVNATPEDRGVARKDQLHYRIIIQNCVSRCLFSMGSVSLKRHVKALRTSMFFEVNGLRFKHRILEKEKELKEELNNKIRDKKRELGKDFYGNAEQAQLKIKLEEWYWTTLLEYLLDILSESNALLQARQFIESGESL